LVTSRTSPARFDSSTACGWLVRENMFDNVQRQSKVCLSKRLPGREQIAATTHRR
jgi:hypothetical protein